MTWNNNHVPTVRIQGKDSYSQMMIDMARSLKYSGNSDLAEMILQDKARLNNNVPTAVRKLANDEVHDAMQLIQNKQYANGQDKHHGNLRNSIDKHISSDKMTADIYATAESPEGYKYIQAFEFGLLGTKYYGRHPMQESGRDLDVNKYDNNMLDSSFK